MKKLTLKKIGALISAHKMWTGIIAIAVIIVAYLAYAYTRPAAVPQYTVSRARTGNIVQTVTGTGQVSAANQLDVTSKVSGTILSINAAVGQTVKKGDLIATIDPKDALNSLKSAQIAYAKLVEPPTATNLTNAKDSVDQAYSTAYNAINNSFISFQTVIPSLNTLLYGQKQFLSDQESTNLPTTARQYRLDAANAFDLANVEYQTVLAEYKNLSRASATSTIMATLEDTYALSKDLSASLQKTQNTITFIFTSQPNYLASEASAAQANVASWLSTMNSSVSNILSAETSINSAENALSDLVTGPTSLDLQSQQLSLQQAEDTYADYFIRAPFDGIIGRIPVNVYGQAGSGTAIATIIGNQKIATLSLNEVDAATVKAGDPVSLTFDAINDFTATGTVAEVDLVGTVSSGVVSYGVKVSIGTADPRINPGMSVNATITTNEIDNVLVVPSAAVKTQGNKNYVQVLDPSIVSQYMSALASANGVAASSTRRFASTTSADGGQSGTGFSGSTTRSFGTGATGGTGTAGGVGRNVSLTISSATPPSSQTVTIGQTDGTNTEISGGLSSGAWVVTKTVAGSAATATAAPSLLSSLGGGARAGGGTRVTTGGAARGN